MFREHREKIKVKHFIEVGHVFRDGYLLDQRVNQETKRDTCLILKEVGEVWEIVLSDLNITRVLNQREYKSLIYSGSCSVFLFCKFV